MDAEELRRRVAAYKGWDDVPEAAWRLAVDRGLVEEALAHGEAGVKDLAADLDEFLGELEGGRRPRSPEALEDLRLALFVRYFALWEESVGDSLALEAWEGQPVQASVEERGRIVVTAGYWVSPDRVAKAFRDARRRAMGQRFRPLNERTLLLADFALDQIEGPSVRERMASWNERHAEYNYVDRRVFHTALLKAVRAAFALPQPDHPSLAALLKLLGPDEEASA